MGPVSYTHLQLVLLDSDFSCLPDVVMEGRRVINNITRTASMYLIKTVFSFLLSVITVFTPFNYPFTPIQLTLISMFCVGIPTFFLALEPSRDRITGNFLSTVPVSYTHLDVYKRQGH